MQPAASAGQTLQAIWLTGQFHGVMKPQTPIGSRRMQRGAALLVELVVLAAPRAMVAEVAERRGGLRGLRDSQIGAPISREIVSAISS